MGSISTYRDEGAAAYAAGLNEEDSPYLFLAITNPDAIVASHGRFRATAYDRQAAWRSGYAGARATGGRRLAEAA